MLIWIVNTESRTVNAAIITCEQNISSTTIKLWLASNIIWYLVAWYLQ